MDIRRSIKGECYVEKNRSQNSNNSSNMSNKKKGTIFMADSKVMVDGKLKSVTELTKEEFELKLAQKWGRNKV